MSTKDAYDIVLRQLSSSAIISLLNHRFDDALFGDFSVTFKVMDTECSIVNDRGELVLLKSNHDKEPYRTLVHDIREIDESELRKILGEIVSSMC